MKKNLLFILFCCWLMVPVVKAEVNSADTLLKKPKVGGFTSVRIGKVPFSSLELRLKGTEAGLNVKTWNGDPGTQSLISIRNVLNNYIGTTPLIVINDIPIFSESSEITSINPLSIINEQDIESIKVLKDVQAIAKYGARGGNGVIEIITKETKEKSKVSVHVIGGVSYLDDGYRDVISGNAERDRVKHLYDNMFKLYPNYSKDYPPVVAEGVGSFYKSNDWQKDRYKLGSYQNYNLGLEGSGVFGFYNLRFGYLDESSVKKDVGFKRFMMTMKARYNVSEKFGFDFYISGVQAKRDRYDQQLFEPSYAPFNDDPLFPKNTFISDDERLDENTNNHVVANVKLFYKYNKYLNLTSMGGLVYENYRRDYFTPSTLNNGVIEAFGASAQKQRFMNITKAAYNRTFEKHKISGEAGFELNNSRFESISVKGTRSGSAFSDFVKIVTGYEKHQVEGGSNAYDVNLFSVFANADYMYDERYGFGAVIRYDGVSNLHKDNRWNLYPTVSAIWNFKNESFLKDNSLLSSGKLTIAGGKTGYFTYSDSYFMGRIAAAGQYNGVESAVISEQYDNSLVLPEVNQYNATINLGFLNRFDLSVTAFSKIGENYYNRYTTYLYSGALAHYQNDLEVKTNGYEVEFRSENFDNGVFKWNTSVNLSSMTSEITKTVGGSNSEFSALKKGESLSTIYAYEASAMAGDSYVSPKTGLPYKIGGQQIYKGVPAIKDKNGDGILNSKDMVAIADMQPDLFGGISNSFAYKNFYLDANILFSIGGDIVMESVKDRYAMDEYNHMLMKDNGKTTPYYFVNRGSIQGISEVKDASYVKLHNITFGYRFNKGLHKSIKYLDVYCSATNLLTINKYDGFSTEESRDAITRFNLSSTGSPLYKTIVVGMKINF